MLRTVTHLKGMFLHAKDGDIGAVDECLFDDERWAIRYLTVRASPWHGGEVLISPISILHADWQSRRLDVSLTKKQVEDSPNMDTHLAVSRQHEAEFLGYYGYPYYWQGPFMWGPAYYPSGGTVPAISSNETLSQRAQRESEDSHLRNSAAVDGYHVEASDGEIGHVRDFVMDDETWAIRYIEVATRNWWPGKKVLLSPGWIQRVSWDDSKVYVGLSREAIKSAPEYIESAPLTREYEERLHTHYGRPPYWLHDAEPKAAHSLSGV